MEEKFPDRIDSKFRYVLLASARAEQIMRGARPKLDVRSHKPTSVAMQEVTYEMVDWGYGPSPAVLEDQLTTLSMDDLDAEVDEDAVDAVDAAVDEDEEEEEVH